MSAGKCKIEVLVVIFMCKWKGTKLPYFILLYKSQQVAHVTGFILSDDCCTCFGHHHHPSSGAQNNCNYSIW